MKREGERRRGKREEVCWLSLVVARRCCLLLVGALAVRSFFVVTRSLLGVVVARDRSSVVAERGPE